MPTRLGFEWLLILSVVACYETTRPTQQNQYSGVISIKSVHSISLPRKEVSSISVPSDGVWNLFQNFDLNSITFAVGFPPDTGPTYDSIAHQSCTLYNLSITSGELQCAAPGIFIDIPTNSPYPALSFDQYGNRLVVGRRFTTYHTDTCLQFTPSGCAAWQVDYGIETKDEEAQLYRILDGQPQLIHTGTGGRVLASFAVLDNSLHVLSAIYAGYAMDTHLLRIDEDDLNIADLGPVRTLLPAVNGLLFVDRTSALQYSARHAALY